MASLQEITGDPEVDGVKVKMYAVTGLPHWCSAWVGKFGTDNYWKRIIVSPLNTRQIEEGWTGEFVSAQAALDDVVSKIS